MFIDGEWRAALNARTFQVSNPATGEKLADVPDGGAGDAEYLDTKLAGFAI